MRVLFYSDTNEFGGHEIMACHLANELSKLATVMFAYKGKEITKYINNCRSAKDQEISVHFGYVS